MTRHQDPSVYARLAEAEELNRALEHALESRVVVEQAKGVLKERLGLTLEDSLAVLQLAARTQSTDLQQLAGRVVDEAETPGPIIMTLAREARWDAISLRERNDAGRERAATLWDAVAAQRARLEKPWRAALHGNDGSRKGRA